MKLKHNLLLGCGRGVTEWISTIGSRQSLLLWRSPAWHSQIDRLLTLARNDDPIGILSRHMVCFAREAVFEGKTLILEAEQAERFNAAGAVEHMVNDDLIIVCKPEDRTAVTTAVLEIARCAGYTGCATNQPRPPT